MAFLTHSHNAERAPNAKRRARALDHDGFEDRLPHERPRHIGQVATTVARQSGTESLRHWLAQAAKTENEEERDEAQRIAGRIANLMGLDADQIGREAA